MPLVRSRLIVDAALYLRERGVDVDALMAEHGVPRIEGDEKHVTVALDALRAFFAAAARAARDPLLGIHLAEAAERGSFGVVEFVCRSAPTIREALRRVARYGGLLNGAVEVTFEETATGAVLHHRLPGEPRCLDRVCNEYTVALLLREVRNGAGTTDVALRIDLAHAAPEDADAVADALGTKQIRYDAGENAIVFDPSVLDLAVPTADAALLAFLDEQAERAIAEQGTGPTFRATLLRLIREGIGEAGLDLTKIARGLGMSARTLQRRLAEEGSSFQDLVDDVRRQTAIDEVRGTDRPIADIASSLGYSDLRPFLRAFKRWIGSTPAQYRALARTDTDVVAKRPTARGRPRSG